jgi:hypothetical protein
MAQQGRRSTSVQTGTFAVTAILAVVACTSFAKRTVDDYDPGPAPRQQFVKDNEMCAKQAEGDQRRYGYGGDLGVQTTYNRMYDACMRASGYRLRQAEGK